MIQSIIEREVRGQELSDPPAPAAFLPRVCFSKAGLTPPQGCSPSLTLFLQGNYVSALLPSRGISFPNVFSSSSHHESSPRFCLNSSSRDPHPRRLCTPVRERTGCAQWGPCQLEPQCVEPRRSEVSDPARGTPRSASASFLPLSLPRYRRLDTKSFPKDGFAQSPSRSEIKQFCFRQRFFFFSIPSGEGVTKTSIVLHAATVLMKVLSPIRLECQLPHHESDVR